MITAAAAHVQRLLLGGYADERSLDGSIDARVHRGFAEDNQVQSSRKIVITPGGNSSEDSLSADKMGFTTAAEERLRACDPD